MADPHLIWAGAFLMSVGMLCVTALRMWRGWLALKRLELSPRMDLDRAAELMPSARIEISNLKERLRKLEAIATGIDL
jgi:hypothetical protein